MPVNNKPREFDSYRDIVGESEPHPPHLEKAKASLLLADILAMRLSVLLKALDQSGIARHGQESTQQALEDYRQSRK